MSTLAPAETEHRTRVFAALAARNRLIAILRIAVPALGALVLGGLALQLFIATLAPDFGFASFSVDRDRLVIDAPSYAAMSSDGNSYEVTAAAAAAALDRTDVVDLTDVLLKVRKPSGDVMTAAAQEAQLQITEQLVRVEGVTRVADDNGAHGTLVGVLANIPDETMTADGAVAITFASGATLEASGMHYANGDGSWRFTDVTLVLPSLPASVVSPAAAPAEPEVRP